VVGIWNWAPAAVICCLARLMRWAMVASGTRNARAIWAVVSPPTARSVSATCDGAVSAGWQHRNNKVNESSLASTAEPGGGSNAAALASRRRRALSLRHWSASRRAATVISHPRGLCGMPRFAQVTLASSKASCTASSQASKWPWWRTNAPRTCGASSRSVAPTSPPAAMSCLTSPTRPRP
jgi:hypothetical protein